jgi:hypothetical protein
VTVNEIDVDIERRAYEVVWYEFSALRGLTPDEKASGPNKLRSFIHVLAEIGEREPAENRESGDGNASRIRADFTLKGSYDCAGAKR